MRSEWLAIRASLEGLDQALTLLNSALAPQAHQESLNRTVFRPLFHEVYAALERVSTDFGEQLPDGARSRLKVFLTDWRKDFTSTEAANPQHTARCALALLGLKSQLDLLLADRTPELRSLTERAFMHLQRTIVVNDRVRKEWGSAFKRDEPTCEALGAVHLLSHGIWAFKVNAAGGRTDLVYRDSPIERSKVVSTSEGLVLTEWKRVLEPRELSAKLEEARAQTDRYSEGPLGGIELTRNRYLIMVSSETLSVPADFEEKNVWYRPRNVAVQPLQPSQSARKRQSKR